MCQTSLSLGCILPGRTAHGTLPLVMFCDLDIHELSTQFLMLCWPRHSRSPPTHPPPPLDCPDGGTPCNCVLPRKAATHVTLDDNCSGVSVLLAVTPAFKLRARQQEQSGIRWSSVRCKNNNNVAQHRTACQAEDRALHYWNASFRVTRQYRAVQDG